VHSLINISTSKVSDKQHLSNQSHPVFPDPFSGFVLIHSVVLFWSSFSSTLLFVRKFLDYEMNFTELVNIIHKVWR
jgi:hypothetical protein